jgi:class 3 adenylate cyclase
MVNITEAIASHSAPASILASQVVRDLCRGKKLPFSEHGEVELSGLDEPTRLFEVDWRHSV